MIYKFSDLMNLISEASVPAYVAEHVFANKDKMAKSLADTGLYTFEISGQLIEVRLTPDV